MTLDFNIHFFKRSNLAAAVLFAGLLDALNVLEFPSQGGSGGEQQNVGQVGAKAF